MINAILGKKVGMTRIFDKNNKAIPVTVIQAGPCDVVQIKTKEKDGYGAVQVVYDTKKHITKPVKGHLMKVKSKQNRYIKEIRTDETEKDVEKENQNDSETQDLKIGDKITVEIFKPDDNVQISAISKGKGFAGAMKRHGFAGQPASHGHQKPRGVGSIGCRYPQRTIKGKRMSGHMGTTKITVKGLKIIDVDQENNLLAISGAIPGPNKGLIQIIGENK